MDREYTEGGYFDLISRNRLKNADQSEMLEGTLLVSIESQEELASASIRAFLEENPTVFFRALRKLSLPQQDLILCYYILNKTQTQLGKAVTNNSQTMTSMLLRAGINSLCAMFLWPDGPSTLIMDKIVTGIGHGTVEMAKTEPETKMAEGYYRKSPKMVRLKTAEVIALLLAHKSYDVVAKKLGVWRPELRKYLRSLTKILTGTEERDAKLLGAVLFNLVDVLPFSGKNPTKRNQRRTEDYHAKDPDCLAQFRVRFDGPGWQSVFPTHAFSNK
jgi:hypothetical protein